MEPELGPSEPGVSNSGDIASCDEVRLGRAVPFFAVCGGVVDPPVGFAGLLVLEAWLPDVVVARALLRRGVCFSRVMRN